MKIFKKPNMSDNWKCPICGKNTKKEIVLIGILGTETGGNIQAEPFHLDCIELTYHKDLCFLGQKFGKRKKKGKEDG